MFLSNWRVTWTKIRNVQLFIIHFLVNNRNREVSIMSRMLIWDWSMWCKQKPSRSIVSVQDTAPPPLSDCLPAHSARTSTWLSSARTGTGGRVTHTETRWGWDSSRVIRERTWRITRKKVGIFLWMTMNSQSVKLEFSVKSWHQDPAAASQLIF